MNVKSGEEFAQCCIHHPKRAPSRSKTLGLVGFRCLRSCMGSSCAWYYHILARMWTFRSHRSWFERQFHVLKLFSVSILRRFWQLLRAESWFWRQFHVFKPFWWPPWPPGGPGHVRPLAAGAQSGAQKWPKNFDFLQNFKNLKKTFWIELNWIEFNEKWNYYIWEKIYMKIIIRLLLYTLT